MLKSQEFNNYHEPLSQEWINGDTKRSGNTLHKTKHLRSNKLSYRARLDPVATSYLEVCIEKTRSIPG